RVGVPLNQFLSDAHGIPVLDLDFRSIDDRILFAFTPTIVDNRNFRIAIHHDPFAVFVPHRDAGVMNVSVLLGIKTHEFNAAGVLALQHGLLNAFARRTADVEGPHRELCTGFADRLRSDDAYRLAFLDQTAPRQIAPITGAADAARGLACQHRPNPDAIHTGL